MAPRTAPAPDTRLDVGGLSVRYGAVLAVDDVDLQVGRGEVVSLLGPSGCGKSSLLHAVAGLVPAAGTVQVDGRDVSGQRPDQRNLGLMFQEGALFPHLDVTGNVGFGLRMQGWSRERRAERVDEVLDLVGLAGLHDRRIDELSGGQAQRVALARAIAPRPSLLLLDEPLSSLDRRLRDRLIEDLPAVFAAVEAAVVHVTHDQDEAMALADRVAVMRAGRLERVATPTSLWDDPGSAFVASFLGWHNIFTTRSDAVGDHPHLELPDRVRSRLSGSVSGHAGTGGRRPGAADVDQATAEPGTAGPAGVLVVGVDAARVLVGRASGEAERAVCWDGRVVGHHFAGDHVTVDVNLHDAAPGPPESAAPVVLRATGPVHTMPAVGSEVTVAVPDDAWVALAPD